MPILFGVFIILLPCIFGVSNQIEIKSSNAEVDFVIQQNENIIPIEVKAGTKGALQSMHLFMKEKVSKKGIRISLENFGTYSDIDVYPLYSVGNILG